MKPDNHGTIDRRTFIKTAAGAAAGLGLLGRNAHAADRKPSIIYILLDDAGYGDLGCYGQRKFETPGIDAMAAEGVRFTSHYSGSTVCAPSRCCLLTGLHTGHAYIRGNRSAHPEGQEPIPAGAVTVAELLRSAGYATGAFGKWGLGPAGSSGDPLRQGFDEFYGYICQSNAHNYYPDHLWDNGNKIELDGDTYSHNLIMRRAFDFIRKNSGRPFFCYLPVTIPHASMHVPDRWSRPFRKKFRQFESMMGVYAGPMITNPPAQFAGMMTLLDRQVADLIDLLGELGIDDNTLVILTSDNGPHQEGGHNPAFFDSNGPLRGIKRDLYEGGVRVPMIARWPGKISPGAVSDHVSAFWDVLPTLCEIAGAKTPRDTDGISFAPTLLGNPEKQRAHDYLYWEFPSVGGKQAARMGNWKGLRLNLFENQDAPVELYNLEHDIGEQNNVAPENPEVVEKMKQIFKTARTESELFKLFG